MAEILILLVPLALFMVLRANPQRRRVMAQQDMIKQLAPGDRVVTASGLIGTLMGIEGDRAAVEAAPGVVLEFLLPAIVRRLDEDASPASPDPAADADHGSEALAAAAAPAGSSDTEMPSDFDVPDDLSGLDLTHDGEGGSGSNGGSDAASHGGSAADHHPSNDPHPTDAESHDPTPGTDPRASGPEES